MVEIQGPHGTGETGATPEASRSSSFASFAGPQMLAPVYQLYFNKILKIKIKRLGPCNVSWPISRITPFDFSKPPESGEDSSHCPDEETEAQIVSGREPACPSFHQTF